MASARNLTLAFFSPLACDDWVNRLVARASKFPYCHVELYFESTNQCFSVQIGENVNLRTKTLASPCYEVVTLAVSLKEYDACLDFCRKAMRENIGFDNRGMYTSYFAGIQHCCCCCIGCCHRPSMETRRTFCSKIICEALQAASIEEVQHRVPSFTTPSRLYSDIMHSKRRVCASVPYKREQMLKKQIIQFNNRAYMRVSDVF